MARPQRRPGRVAPPSRSVSSTGALLKLNLLVASSLDVATVLREIARAAATLMEAKLVGVWVADERARMLELRALSDDRLLDELPNRVMPFGHGALGRAALERRRVVIDDAERDERATSVEWFKARGITAAMVVPITFHDSLLGVLALARGAPFRIDQEAEELLDGFIAQSAIALRHAQLYEVAGRRQREAEVLAGLVRGINGSLDLDTVLQHVAEGAQELCQADTARIALRDAESDVFVFRYWTRAWRRDPKDLRIEPGIGLGGLVLSTGRPMRTDDWANDARIRQGQYREVVEAEGTVAILVAPVRLGDRVEGLLYATSHTPRVFSDRDEELLVELADHAAIAIGNAQLYARTVSLSRGLVEAQETERRSIAHELHDQIGQDLTAIKLLLRRAARADGDARRVPEADALSLVDDLIDRVRGLSLDLRPPMLDDLGLVPTLTWFLRRYGTRTAVRVAFAHEGAERRFERATETAIFRIVQEALTNVARHATATEATVRLRADEAALSLEIEDNGCGFDVARAGARPTAGLAGMRDRARWLRGRLVIDSAPGRGTRVRADLPAPAAEPCRAGRA